MSWVQEAAPEDGRDGMRVHCGIKNRVPAASLEQVAVCTYTTHLCWFEMCVHPPRACTHLHEHTHCQPPSHPATQPPSHPATQPPSHPATLHTCVPAPARLPNYPPSPPPPRPAQPLTVHTQTPTHKHTDS